MGMTAGSIALAVLAGIGITLMIVGGILIPVFKKVVQNNVNNKLPLKNGSDSFNTWKNPPAPIYTKFYVFDVVNSEDVLNNRTKPVLKEKGPYTYREIRTKENVTFEENGTILRYRERKAYVFERGMSVGDENDTFTSVNLPLLVAGTEFPSGLSADLVRLFADYFGERLLSNFTVGGYLWGYYDTHLKNIPIINHIKLGLFTGDKGNDTDDGVYDIFTGTNDISKLNQIHSWKGEENLNWWYSNISNMINGTDGTMWHPFIKETDTLYLFSSQICRSIHVTYNNTYTLKNKAKVKRFTPPRSVFAEVKENPYNKGFCPPSGCLKAGVLDIASCSSGAPIVMSLPHFYQADKEYLNSVTGLHPDAQKHSTVIDIEPTTGAAFNAHKRLQVNAQIHNVTSIRDSTAVKDGIIFPILWLDEGATISDSGLKTFTKEVINPIILTIAIQYGLMGLGFLILVFVLGAFLVRLALSRRNRTERGLLSDVAGDE